MIDAIVRRLRAFRVARIVYGHVNKSHRAISIFVASDEVADKIRMLLKDIAVEHNKRIPYTKYHV